MLKSPLSFVEKVLQSPCSLKELRIHSFPDDPSAHDNDLVERLYQEFSADFDLARAELSEKYGPPTRTGNQSDPAIPLNGVFRFAIWEIDGSQLYIAAAHEDREIPILLVIGSDQGNVA